MMRIFSSLYEKKHGENVYNFILRLYNSRYIRCIYGIALYLIFLDCILNSLISTIDSTTYSLLYILATHA